MSDDHYPIEIMLSDKKLKKLRNFVFEFVGLCVLALVFFFVLMSWAEKAVGDGDSWLSWGSENWRFMLGVSCVFLIPVMGIALFMLRRVSKMHNRKCLGVPGMIIDAEGLVWDVSAKNGPVRIGRRDIVGVKVKWGKERFAGVHYIAPENLVVVCLKNPAEFIRHRPGLVTRLLLRANKKMYGSPLLLNDAVLDVRFKDLVILMEREFGHVPKGVEQ